MQQTVSDRALDRLKELIDAEEKRIADVVTGQAAIMMPSESYRFMVGQIHGLRLAEVYRTEAIAAVQAEGASDRQKAAV